MFAVAPVPAELTAAPGSSLQGRHLLAVTDFTAADLSAVTRLATYLKQRPLTEQGRLLSGKTLAMFFEKPSLRTRVSFEVAMTQLGGSVLFAKGDEFSIGTRETPEDAARVLSRFADAIVIRTHAHEPLQRFAGASSVPVINGLSALAHPCQALADILTMQERFGSLQGLRIAYLGDARNNVAASLAQAAVMSGASINFGCPPSHRPSESFLAELKELGKATGAQGRAFTSAIRAVRGVDVIYTDVWTSMGEEGATERNRAVLSPYRVTEQLFKHAAPHAVFMHCLPAHRGEEMTAEVIDGPRSIVFDQAENRMHAQKAALVALLTDLRGFPV
jgi:ornithine carbamoyltransferase